MKTFWHNLNERERLSLGVGSVILLIYLIYLFVFSPLLETVQLRRLELKDKKETFAWMQTVRSEFIGERRSKPKQVSTSQMLKILAKELDTSAFKTTSYQLQQMDNNRIQLSYESVPYNSFLAWLANLDKKYAIPIEQLSMVKNKKPGMVQLSLTIKLNSQ